MTPREKLHFIAKEVGRLSEEGAPPSLVKLANGDIKACHDGLDAADAAEIARSGTCEFIRRGVVSRIDRIFQDLGLRA